MFFSLNREMDEDFLSLFPTPTPYQLKTVLLTQKNFSFPLLKSVRTLNGREQDLSMKNDRYFINNK